MDGSIALFMWSQPAINTDGPVSGPGPRAAHSCDLIGNKLYVFGGWNGKKVRKRGVHGDGSAATKTSGEKEAFLFKFCDMGAPCFDFIGLE